MKKQIPSTPLIKATNEALGNISVSDDLIQEFVKDFFPKTNEAGQTLFDANGNYPVSREERDVMIEELSAKFGEIFNILRIDRNDPNSMNTPHRLAKMWVNELFAGRFEPAPKITVFPNRKQVDELIISRNITVMSVCSHHWQPISGTCAIGYIPGDYVLGLSKLSRIVEWFSRRGQIQEELGEQIADFIEDIIKPKALGVVIESKHYCMIARGVNESEEKASMVTSVMRGSLRDELPLRNEFLTLIRE
ncbi:MAG: GTP cyclohydrolase I [Ignavibacteria bacterium]|jgi:GTP cyclohydrolase I